MRINTCSGAVDIERAKNTRGGPSGASVPASAENVCEDAMTLATTPLLQPSAGRSRVETAVELMNQAQRLLRAEELERAERQRNFKVTPFDEREKAAIRKAELRRIKQEHMLSVDRRWFWDFANDALDTMREASSEAKRKGEQMRAQAIDARIDAACVQLEAVQKRAAT
jgi:hypothetical protein